MYVNQISQLPHLPVDIVKDAHKSNLCTYSIALEGWRRGLALKFFGKKNLRFSLSSKERTHVFNRSRGDMVPSNAVKACVDKSKTKEMLDGYGVPVPKGKRFLGNEILDEEIISYAISLGFPVVVKPNSGSLGRGVISNIKDENSLTEALRFVRKDLNSSDIIIEQHMNGEDFRVYVIGDKVAGVVKRIPANITGNGISTIKQLIEMKNHLRMKNPYLAHGLIKVDIEVINQIILAGYTLESVPQNGELIYLRTKCNASAGGDPIDFTDSLSSKFKEIAVKSAMAIPGLIQCGVDMMIKNADSSSGGEGVVIEINSRAELGVHLFPTKGGARDIPSAIIDYYFPETVGQKEVAKNLSLYFDFKNINNVLENSSIKEIEVSPAPQETIIQKRWIISGDVQNVGFKKWLQGQAKRLNLNGHTRNLKTGNLLVIVAGKRKNIDEFKKQCYEGSKNVNVSKIKETSWKRSVMLGFRII